jgi:hypothetical protein
MKTKNDKERSENMELKATKGTAMYFKVVESLALFSDGLTIIIIITQRLLVLSRLVRVALLSRPNHPCVKQRAWYDRASVSELPDVHLDGRGRG